MGVLHVVLLVMVDVVLHHLTATMIGVAVEVAAAAVVTVGVNSRLYFEN